MAEQKWFEGLRRQIKHRCGPGWGIDEAAVVLDVHIEGMAHQILGHPHRQVVDDRRAVGVSGSRSFVDADKKITALQGKNFVRHTYLCK